MSAESKIKCKAQCGMCKNKQLYDAKHKFPFHCCRKGQHQNTAIETKPYCGEKFARPNYLTKDCKFATMEIVLTSL